MTGTLLATFLALMVTGIPVAIAMAGASLIYILVTQSTPPMAVRGVGRSSRNTKPRASAMTGVNTLMKLTLVALHVFNKKK